MSKYLSLEFSKNKKLLNKGFKKLRKLGYVAFQDFWCCSSCGWAALSDEQAKKAVFYHHQDKVSMLEKGEVYLSWSGHGNEIVKVFTDLGLEVDWDGSDRKRILIYLS